MLQHANAVAFRGQFVFWYKSGVKPHNDVISERCPVNILSRRTMSRTRCLLSTASSCVLLSSTPGCSPPPQQLLFLGILEVTLCQMEMENLRNFQQYQVKSKVRWSNGQSVQRPTEPLQSESKKATWNSSERSLEFLGKIFGIL